MLTARENNCVIGMRVRSELSTDVQLNKNFGEQSNAVTLLDGYRRMRKILTVRAAVALCYLKKKKQPSLTYAWS